MYLKRIRARQSLAVVAALLLTFSLAELSAQDVEVAPPIRGELPSVPEVYVSRPPGIEVRSYASGMQIIWSLEFAPDGRLFIAERAGRVRVVSADGILEPEPWLTLPNLSSRLEDGLLGLTLDPSFSEQPWVYLYYAVSKDSRIVNRVSRFRDQAGRGGSEQILLDGIPSERIHNGGRLRFGPDGMLYVTTGDVSQPMRAQNLNDLGGSVLRITPEGEVPADNPWPDNPIWAYGLRSSHGLAFRPSDGTLFAADNGPSTEWRDPPIRARDELNIIRKGANYGWPLVVGAPGMAQFADPLLAWAPRSVPPGDLAFYNDGRMPELQGDLFLSSLAAEALLRIRFEDSSNPNRVTSIERWFNSGEPGGSIYGRLRGITIGPDGAIYVGTGNHDGRSALRDGDDQVLRIGPARR